jgi:hypothetical protein
MVGVDDNQYTSDGQYQQQSLNAQVEQISLLPYEKEKDVEDNRSDEIEIKHNQSP